MQKFFGMYYPSTTLPDDWVKLAALYWDRVGRIEWPSLGLRSDSDTVQQLMDEIGFIVNLTPSHEDLSTVADMLIAMFSKNHEELLKHYSISALIQAYGTGLLPKLNLIAQELFTPELFSSMVNADLGQMAGFLNPESAQVVIQDGVLEFKVDTLEKIERRALNVHQGMFFFYMKTLAEQMASARQLQLVTDDEFELVAASGYTLERIAQAMLLSNDKQPHLVGADLANDEIELQMATIAIQSVLPRDIASISVKQIIKLRNQHRDEMTAFQEYLHGFAADLANLQDVQDHRALRAHLEVEYEKRLKPQMDELKKLLRSIGIDTVEGLLNVRVGLPPVAATSAEYFVQAHASLPFNPLLAGAGALALSTFPVIRKKQKEIKETVRSSPAAYLLYIQEGLEPAKATTWITRQARQILFRV